MSPQLLHRSYRLYKHLSQASEKVISQSETLQSTHSAVLDVCHWTTL